MTYSILICFLGTALHIPSIILRYVPFKNIITKKQSKTLTVIYTLALILNFVICMIVDNTIGVGIAFFKVNLVIFCVLMSAVNIAIVRNHLREHLFVFGVVAISILLLFTVSLAINELIEGNDVRQFMVQISIILIISFCVCYIPMKKLIIDAVTPFLNLDSKDYWKNIWFIPIAMFLASFLAYPMDTYMDTPRQFLSRMMIGGATLFVCRAISNDYGRFFEQEIMGKQIQIQKQYYEELSKSVENDRRARHDFKQHIFALRGLANSDDREGLVKYCNAMEHENAMSELNCEIPKCGNAALDGLIYHYIRAAKENNIDFSFSGYVGKINISDIDLCVLVGNALTNALEAALGCNTKRFIDIAVSIDNNFLIITIDNSFDGKLISKGDTILSRKRGNAEGIGISSMKKICEKYNGSASFEANRNVFQTGFILNLQ